MADFSDYLEDALINHVFRNTAYTSPTTVYVALFTAGTGLEANNPTSEVTGAGYVRKAVTFSAPSGGESDNTVEIEWDPAGVGGWGEITHAAVVDHLDNDNWGTNVNVLMHTALDTPRTINENDIIKFPESSLTVQVL